MYSIKYNFGNLSNQATPQPRGYRGLYINLDRSPERRDRIEEQIQLYGLSERYERFPAIDASTVRLGAGMLSAAQLACFQSNYELLKKAKASGIAVHVLEDDVVLSKQTESAILTLQERGAFSNFDIVFTETFVETDIKLLRLLKTWFEWYERDGFSQIRVCDITRAYSGGSTSYVVEPAAMDKVLSIMKSGIEEASLPIDLLLRREAAKGRLRLGCIFPFVTTIQVGELAQTTIKDRDTATAQVSREVFDLLRYSFFIERDFTGAAKSAIDLLHTKSRDLELDAHSKLIASVLNFAVSSKELSDF